jgi:hypothetical protein
MADDLVTTPVPSPPVDAGGPPLQTTLQFSYVLPEGPISWVLAGLGCLGALVLFARLFVKCMGWDKLPEKRKRR